MDADTSPERRPHKPRLEAAPSSPPTAPPSPRSASRRRSRCPASATNCAIPSPNSPTGPTTSRNDRQGRPARRQPLHRRSMPMASARRCRRWTANGNAGRSARRRPSGRSTPTPGATRRRETGEGRSDSQGACSRHGAPEPVEAADTKALARIDAQAERAALVARLESALMERYIIKRAPVTVGDVSDRPHRVPLPRRHVARGLHRIDLPAGHRHQQPFGRAVDGGCGRGTQLARTAGVGQRGLQTPGVAGSVGARRQDAGLRAEPGRPGSAEARARVTLGQPHRAGPRRRRRQAGAATATAEKASARGGGGRKAVLAAIEAVLIAKRVPAKQRDAVMAAATEKLAQRLREGQSLKVKVYDKAAPSQRPVVVPTPEVQRTRERTAPVR